MRALPILALAVALVTGCARPSVPDLTGRPSGTAPPPADPTAIPTAPAEALERIASIEQDGVRLTIELERNPLPAGEPTWLTTTVTNTGDDDLIWFHDGCAVAIYVGGTIVGARWRPGLGGGQVGAAAEYRNDALEQIGADNASIRVDFAPEERVGHKGSYGCADIGIGDTVVPGQSIEQRAQWDGAAGTLLGPPPGGLVELLGTFQFYWRESTGEPEDITDGRIEFALTAWIEARGPIGLHPTEAIDVALTDPRLVEIVASRELRNGNEPIVRFDLIAGVWQVGLLDYSEPPVVHLVIVDGATGLVVDWVERVWDYEVDGFP